MDDRLKLGTGLNLGGWLSQAPYEDEHRTRFVTEADFARIAAWGFDNVRIPFDYPLLVPDGRFDETSMEAGFAWLDRAIEWAGNHGLRAILDMHSLPGYTFMDPVNNPDAVPALFVEPQVQAHFFGLWRAIAARYLGRFDHVVFELANEIAAPDAGQWNDLAARAVRAIREVDTKRPIVVGSNCWNVTFTFKELALIDDPAIIYNFHFYNPFPFTHQLAPWSPELMAYGKTVDYPGRIPGLRSAGATARAAGNERIGDQLSQLADFFEERVSDATYLEELMGDAFAFAATHDVPLYCGEFGVYAVASPDSMARWFRDVLGIFGRRDVSWSVWSYKGEGFGVVGQDGKVISEEVLALLRGFGG